MRIWKRNVLSVAALTVVAAGPALAVKVNFESSASITNLGYELVDLRPNDGIAPSALFVPGTGDNFVSTWIQRNDRSSLSAGKFGAGSLSSALNVGNVSASNFVSDGGTSFEVQALGKARVAYGDWYRGYGSGAEYVARVELAPYTAMVWTGDIAAQAKSDLTFTAPSLRYSDATIFFGNYSQSQTFQVHSVANPAYGSNFQEISGSASFVMTNPTDSAHISYATFRTSAGGGLAAPIPEPGTYALMAAGLGFVGFAAKRRKDASAS